MARVFELYGPFNWAAPFGQPGLQPNEYHMWSPPGFNPGHGVFAVSAHPWRLSNVQALRVDLLTTVYLRDRSDAILNFQVRNVGPESVRGYTYWVTWARTTGP
jgi:hypothetical protein